MFGEPGSLAKTVACAQLAQLGDTLDISLIRFRAPWKASLPAWKRQRIPGATKQPPYKV